MIWSDTGSLHYSKQRANTYILLNTSWVGRRDSEVLALIPNSSLEHALQPVVMPQVNAVPVLTRD